MTQTGTKTEPKSYERVFFGLFETRGLVGGMDLAPKHPFPSGIPSGKGDSSGKTVEKKR